MLLLIMNSINVVILHYLLLVFKILKVQALVLKRIINLFILNYEAPYVIYFQKTFY